jgi:hypothetical protein
MILREISIISIKYKLVDCYYFNDKKKRVHFTHKNNY